MRFIDAFYEITRASWSFNNQNKNVLIASELIFMRHCIVYVLQTKILFVNRYYFNLYWAIHHGFPILFFAKDELRRAETKSINHGVDIKWRANEIPTYDEDKPTPCFISRDKKESRDSSIIPDWCPPGWAMRSIIRNSSRRITSIPL